MFGSRTVFVIGAGASNDLDFPLGATFRDKIAEFLAPVANGDLRTEAHQIVVHALRRKAEQDADGDNGLAYRKAAGEIVSHIGLVRSVDEFINHHAGNRHIETVSKMAICWLILQAEAESELLLENEYGQLLNIPKLRTKDAWLLELLNLMRAGSHVSDPRAPFQNLSFIVFNYDRCLEVFFLRTLVQLFGTSETEARKIVEDVPIIHPYGRVGRPDETDVEFGGFDQITSDKLIQLAGGIRTFGESERDQNQMATIRALIEEATNLVFIGFAFHDQNLDFFESSRDRLGFWPQTFATAVNLPSVHQDHIRGSLLKKMNFPRAAATFNPQFLNNVKGAELLRLYDQVLRN